MLLVSQVYSGAYAGMWEFLNVSKVQCHGDVLYPQPQAYWSNTQ